MLNTPAAPVAATINQGTGAWSITFNQALTPGVITAGAVTFKWTPTSLWRQASSATAAGSTLSGASNVIGMPAGAEGARFNAAANQLRDWQGRLVSSFNFAGLVVT